MFLENTVSIDMDSDYMGEIVIVIANGRFRSPLDSHGKEQKLCCGVDNELVNI